MKILTVCQNGNNRSVQFAHLLRYKYMGSDTIPVGTDMHTPETLEMLYEWADHIILLDDMLLARIPNKYHKKLKDWNVGVDVYPRPFNPVLYKMAKNIIENNPLS